MRTLARPTSIAKHTPVLRQAVEHLGGAMEEGDRLQLEEAIEGYVVEAMPVEIPVSLIHRQVRKVGAPYLAEQLYIVQHPDEVMLRTHIRASS